VEEPNAAAPIFLPFTKIAVHEKVHKGMRIINDCGRLLGNFVSCTQLYKGMQHVMAHVVCDNARHLGTACVF